MFVCVLGLGLLTFTRAGLRGGLAFLGIWFIACTGGTQRWVFDFLGFGVYTHRVGNLNCMGRVGCQKQVLSFRVCVCWNLEHCFAEF